MSILQSFLDWGKEKSIPYSASIVSGRASITFFVPDSLFWCPLHWEERKSLELRSYMSPGNGTETWEEGTLSPPLHSLSVGRDGLLGLLCSGQVGTKSRGGSIGWKITRGDIKGRGILAKLAGQSLRYQIRGLGTPDSKGVRGSCSTDSSGFLLKPRK